MRTLVKNKYIAILQMRSGVAIAPPPPPKKEAFSFLHQILDTRRVDTPVMTWVQIQARGSGDMLPGNLIKKVQSGAFLVFQNTLIST